MTSPSTYLRLCALLQDLRYLGPELMASQQDADVRTAIRRDLGSIVREASALQRELARTCGPAPAAFGA